MTTNEIRSSAALAAVFSVRLLGLFMVYPVFAVYARQLHGATPETIGLALGAYGLTQGILQIPFGLLSDRVGRKIMIAAGLTLFALGSAVAALSTSIDGMIVGRALQGGGAIGSVVLALVADLTRDESRTRAMAIIGITIGFSFMLALILGPLLAGSIGLTGIFWLMVGLAAVGIAVTEWIVPTPPAAALHPDAAPTAARLRGVLRNVQLLRLDFGIFTLHAILTASFLVVPGILHAAFSVSVQNQWLVYLPVMVVSALVMVPAVIVAEKYHRMKPVFLAAAAVLAASQGALLVGFNNAAAVIAAITAFFVAFNIMEATLPSLLTRLAPPEAKGTATGVYSSAQFLGIFVGGAAGGWAHQVGGTPGTFMVTGALGVLWLIVATLTG